MYYWGYFRNTDTSKDKNGQLYKVVIITDFQNNGYTKEGGELILTSSPFTVNYKGEDDNLFKPYKCSTATVSFYLDRIIKDLYSVRGNDILVTLFKLKDGVTPKEVEFSSGNITDVNYPSNYDYRDYTVEWIGFATPNAFNQSYNSDFNVFEMEAQDALSTLQYYDYTSCTTNNGNNTISDILLNVISSVGIYKNIYISDNLHTPTSDYDGRDITEYLSIYEGNFFNEDGEAKKMLEVLSDIMQYLNMTAVACGDNLFILDYTAIANKYNIYHWIKSEVTVRRGSMYVTLPDDLPWIYKEGRYYNKFKKLGTVEFKHYKDIELNDIADSNINYSLGSTYNKVKVIDDFYFREPFKLIDNVRDNEEYSTLTSYSFNWYDYAGGTQTIKTHTFTVNRSDEEFTLISDENGNKLYNKYYSFVNNSNVEVNTIWWEDTLNYYKDDYGYTQQSWKTTKIERTEGDRFENPRFYDMVKYVGALVADECFIPVDNDNNTTPKLNRCIYFTTGTKASKTGVDTHTSFKPEPWVKNAECRKQKVLEINLSNQEVNDGDYLLLNGDLTFYTMPAPFKNHELPKVGWEFNYIYCYCELDGKYWNGSKWVDSETGFQMTIKHSDNANASIIKNVGYNKNLPKTGYGIPLFKPYSSSSKVKFTFARIWGGSNQIETDLTALRNFEIEVISPVENLIKQTNTTNTEYTNIINNSALEEYDNITLNITTYCGKDKDYSTVYCSESYTESTLTPLYKLARYYNTSTGFLCSAEEHIINNITTQYQLPNTIFDITLYGNYKPYSLVTYKHFEDVTFVVDGMSIDYAANNTTLHLVQKIIGSHNRLITLQKRSKKRDYQRNGDIINNALGVKKDDKIITYSYVAGEGNLYRDGMIVSLNAVGDTLIDWDNPLALDSKSVVRQAYLRFNINDNGELNIYYPNSLAPTAKINENGELLVEPIKDGVIII